jgi:hypothetical protein
MSYDVKEEEIIKKKLMREAHTSLGISSKAYTG